jgi:hypothetical protein
VQINVVISKRLRILTEAKFFEPLLDVTTHGASLRQTGFAQTVEQVLVGTGILIKLPHWANNDLADPNILVFLQTVQPFSTALASSPRPRCPNAEANVRCSSKCTRPLSTTLRA